MMFLPKGDYEVLDDWDTVGMRASASCSVQVKDMFIPEYRAISMGSIINDNVAPGHVYNNGPLYSLALRPGLGRIAGGLSRRRRPGDVEDVQGKDE